MARALTRGFTAGIALTSCVILTTACTTREPLGGPLVAEVSAPTPVDALQAIADGASRCWNRGELGNYATIPELDTQVGRKRILLVEKGGETALPALVIEADGSPTQLRTFGPLSGQPLSNRINADIIRWSTGGSGCR